MAILEDVDNEWTAKNHNQRSLVSGRVYKDKNDIADLESAILHARRALDLAETSSADYLDYIYFLAYFLSLRYDKVSDLQDLESSISYWRTWLQTASKDHHERPLVLSTLSDQLDSKFRKTASRTDIDEAVELAKEACFLSSLRPSMKLVYLRALGLRLKLLWQQFACVDDLVRAVKAWEEVLHESTIVEDKERVVDMADLSQLRYNRYKHIGDLPDLREALCGARDICEMLPETYHLRCNAFSHLCEVIASSTEAGILPKTSLLEAVDAAEKGLAICSNDTQRIGLLNNLMNRHRELYNYRNDTNDLNHAIMYGQRAVKLTPPRDPQRPMWQHNLAICLKLRFEENGDWRVFDEVFLTLREALDTCQSKDDRAMVCNSLSAALQERFRQRPVSADIEESVDLARQAVRDTPPQHQTYTSYLSNLGSRLSSRYSRFGSMPDLTEAIEYDQEALAKANNEIDEAQRLRSLSKKLSTRYRVLHVEEDWSMAVSYLQQAIAMTPDTRYLDQAENYFDLSSCSRDKFETYKSAAESHHLHESIRLLQVAVDLLPPNNSGFMHYFWLLSERKLNLLFYLTSDDQVYQTFDEIVKAGLVCYRDQGAPNHWRILAGRAVNIVYMCKSDWLAAASLGTNLVDLITQARLEDASRDDFQHMLASFLQISAHAAMSLLNAGESPEKALLVKDKGCGLMSGLSISDHSHGGQGLILQDVGLQPRSQSPKSNTLAEMSSAGTASLEQVQTDKSVALFSIQSAGTQLHEFGCLAEYGPLVSFNVTGWRCDAFVVTREKTDIVPLPLLLENDLIKHTQAIVGNDRLTNCRVHERAGNNKKLGAVLAWLWEVAAKPVLDFLGFHGELNIEELPRLWWIVSGRMSIMPLHAAGTGWGSSFENTASRVVSSYVPTLKALAYSRERSRRIAMSSNHSTSLLAVQMAQTPGGNWADLNTAEEMKMITKTAEDADIEVNLLQQPSVNMTVDFMRSANIVHFACHAEPDSQDPSRTALLLQKDQENVDRLTIAQLFNQEHPNAQLAYLSACSTAQQYDKHLLDEGINLGNAFLLIGFPSVIATQWEADDAAATVIAAKFYDKLLQGAGSLIGCEQVARSLHGAVAEYRKQRLGRRGYCSDDIIAWAPYVHIGA